MKRTLTGFVFTLFFFGLLYLLTPVYGFYAHAGKLPFFPIGWMTLPKDAPRAEIVLDPRRSEQGAAALEALARHRDRIGAPGISAAVGMDGRLVWQGTAGWADVFEKRPVTPKTLFRIGSTSKAITGTLLARLVEAGMIGLDEPIRRYLDTSVQPAWAPITPRQLASHTAGLPHYGENQDWLGTYRTIALQTHYGDVREALSVFDGSPLLFPPGTAYHYSSLGIVLLGAVMSEAAGKSYRRLVKEEVLEPTRMTSTRFSPVDPRAHPELATFYYRSGDRYRPWRPVDLSHRLPGGGFVSTPTDLVRLGLSLLDEGYISRPTREAFFTPQPLSTGEVNEEGYALGFRFRAWEVEGVGIARNANHGGVSRGSQCWLLIFFDLDLVMAFAINVRTAKFGTFGRVYADLLRAFTRSARGRSPEAKEAL